MKVPLTDLFVKNLKPTGRQEVFWCTKMPAFALRLNQKGTKTFFVMVGRERRRINLGKYPTTTLQEARRKALDLTDTPSRLSLNEARTLYLTTYIKPNYRPRSASEVERHLIKLTGITAADVTSVMDKLPPSEANHFFGACRTFFNWCERRDIFPSPVRKLRKPHKENSRDRVLTEEEIRRIWHASHGQFGCIVKLALLTAQRRTEIASVERDWLQNDVLHFPATIMKNKKPHAIPLPPSARDLIEQLLSYPKKQTVWNNPKKALDKACGVTDWVLHDCRRSVASYISAAPISAPPHLVDRLLSHTPPTLRRTYNRYEYLDELRTLLDRWQAQLLEIVS